MKPDTTNGEIYTEPSETTTGTTAAGSAALLAMPVTVAVSVGKARATIEELLAIGPKSILTLESKIDDPVDLLVGDRVIARGRLVELGESGAFGVEIIELSSSSDTT
ncbi:MAG: FliM/FliN family flagellar motor switch protein [Parvularculaceae bacterium]|nr:FliM/FliN family flagellar motor switch protein [Parvularculaceae bacterium]